MTGDPISEGDASYVTGFGSAAVNNLGQVVFRSLVANAAGSEDVRPGLILVDGDTKKLVLSNGDVVRRGNNLSRITGFHSPVLNDSGQLAVVASYSTLPSEGTTSAGIVLYDDGEVEFLARENRQIFDNILDLAFNDSGQVMFRAHSRINFGFDLIATPIGQDFRVVLSGGAQAPDTLEGTRFYSPSSFELPVFNHAGHTAFAVGLFGPAVDDSNDEGIFVEANGMLSLVARKGDQAPNTEPGTYFSGLSGDVGLNDLGQVTFNAYLAGVGAQLPIDRAIYSGMGDDLRLVVRTGDTMAVGDSLPEFRALLRPRINRSGQVAFFGTLIGDGISSENNDGVFLASDGDISLIVQEGDKAPGTGPGVRLRLLDHPSLNDMGQVAIRAFLAGPGVDATNGDGIFATDLNGVLRLIARKGDLFDINPDPLVTELREISFASFTPSASTGDGRPRAFNDRGQLVFHLQFTDGSEGIFVATLGIPEPTTLLLFGIGLFFMANRRLIKACPSRLARPHAANCRQIEITECRRQHTAPYRNNPVF